MEKCIFAHDVLDLTVFYSFTASVETYWTNWSDWSACSTTVCNDVGIQVRRRKCVSTQPLPKLVTPACPGPHAERKECSTATCQGNWSMKLSENALLPQDQSLAWGCCGVFYVHLVFLRCFLVGRDHMC